MAAISSSAEEEGAARLGPSAGPSEAPRRAAAPKSPSTPRASNRSGPRGRASVTRRAGPLGACSRSSVLHLDEPLVDTRERCAAVLHELCVDIDLAHVVDDDGDLEAIAVREDVVEKR